MHDFPNYLFYSPFLSCPSQTEIIEVKFFTIDATIEKKEKYKEDKVNV